MFQVSQFGESCATHLLTTMRFREKLAQNGPRFTVFLCPLFVRGHLLHAVEMGAPDLGVDIRGDGLGASNVTAAGFLKVKWHAEHRRSVLWSGTGEKPVQVLV